jgi:hypothetical protein
MTKKILPLSLCIIAYTDDRWKYNFLPKLGCFVQFVPSLERYGREEGWTQVFKAKLGYLPPSDPGPMDLHLHTHSLLSDAIILPVEAMVSLLFINLYFLDCQ